jgi:serine O-acetyltransferase
MPIKDRIDLTFYIEADRIISGRSETTSLQSKVYKIMCPDYLERFMVTLRQLEYYKNCKRNVKDKILYILLKKRFNNLSLKLGFSIPLNCFGPGLFIPHWGTIVVNHNCTVGRYAVLHTSTCIAGSEAKKIGDGFYLSSGSIITGECIVGDNVTVGGGSFVNLSCINSYSLVVGTPAQIKKQRKPWYVEDGETYLNRINMIEELELILYA